MHRHGPIGPSGGQFDRGGARGNGDRLLQFPRVEEQLGELVRGVHIRRVALDHQLRDPDGFWLAAQLRIDADEFAARHGRAGVRPNGLFELPGSTEQAFAAQVPHGRAEPRDGVAVLGR
jgi:hypothetical protein